MRDTEINLQAEIAQVWDELVAFRDVCLPAFYASGGIPDLASPGDLGPAGLRRHQWVEAADKLLGVCPSIAFSRPGSNNAASRGP